MPNSNNNEGKDRDKKREKMKPWKPEWLFKTSHPSQTQSSSIAYGTIPSGIGAVKNQKGTAEENGGHISQ